MSGMETIIDITWRCISYKPSVTLFNQTFQDWELVVCDSYSDDGSWEYIQELAARETAHANFANSKERRLRRL